MREKIVNFGTDSELSGVICTPETGGSAQPALIFWNTGMLHRVGPNRCYVELARAAAARGLASLRFDLSGMGDSATARAVLGRKERIVSEISSAMNLLVQQGIAEQFIMVGLCSGADDCHHAAVADARICGAISVDGYAYSTPRYWRKRLWSKLRSGKSLFQTVKRQFSKKDVSNESSEADFAWAMPDREQVTSDINATTERGMMWLYVYTGEVADIYNYADQFFDMLPGLLRREQIEAVFMQDADHTLSSIADRRAFTDLVLDWVARANVGASRA